MDEYYWTPADFEKLKNARTMSECLVIAMEVLDRMPQPVVMVSGPISTGGKGSVEENTRAFADAIRLLRVSGKTVFQKINNVLPFPWIKGRMRAHVLVNLRNSFNRQGLLRVLTRICFIRSFNQNPRVKRISKIVIIYCTGVYGVGCNRYSAKNRENKNVNKENRENFFHVHPFPKTQAPCNI